jgi:hypothetical protein
MSGIERRGSLRRQYREDLHAFHELLNVGTIDGANDWAARHEGRAQHALWEFRSRGTPRGDVPVNAGDFDLNPTGHRQPI